MEERILTRQQSREVDQIAIEQLGMTGLVLMENAGRGVVDTLVRLGVDGPIVVLCGKGNNAGDGFVIARHLAVRGFSPRVILLAAADELVGDALANLTILKKCGVLITEVSDNISIATLDVVGQPTDWIVDTMLGTGATGEPRPPIDIAIEWMNSQPAKKLAVDVPSGLDCDTGVASAHTVKADHTCTFVAKKQGFLDPVAKEFLGELHVLDIGVSQEMFDPTH